MAGTKVGGQHAWATRQARLGTEAAHAERQKIGAMGGTVSKGGGFAQNPELARIAGAKGGKSSRRTKTFVNPNG